MTLEHKIYMVLLCFGMGGYLVGWFAGRWTMRRQWKARGEEIRKGLEEIREIVNKPFEITSLNGKPFNP